MHTVLKAPIFNPARFNEFTVMEISCINTVPNNIGTAQILNPHGVPVGGLSYSVSNVTRNFTGTYSCVVTSQLSNNSLVTTAEIVIDCKFLT